MESPNTFSAPTPSGLLASDVKTCAAGKGEDQSNQLGSSLRFEDEDVDTAMKTISSSAVEDSGSSRFHTQGTSNAQCHIKMSNLVASIDNASIAAWPARHFDYPKVIVLMLTWEDSDGTHLETESLRLRAVFGHVYRYEVVWCKLPSKDKESEMLELFMSFELGRNKRKDLVIVYYGGHAPGYSRSGSVWSQSRKAYPGTQVIHDLLATAKDCSVDVLLLYDCYGPHCSPNLATRGVVECLFAGERESISRVPEPGCFTSALTDELLIAAKKGTPITVPTLHQRLIARLYNEDGYQVPATSDTVEKNEYGDPFEAAKSRYAPQPSCRLAQHYPRPISLSPMIMEPPEIGKRINITNEWPKVVVAVRLTPETNDEAELKKWLPRSPSVDFVEILGSFSNVLLVLITVEVWDMLTPSAAISFVRFARGPDDLDLPVQPSPDHDMAAKEPFGIASETWSEEAQASDTSSIADQQMGDADLDSEAWTYVTKEDHAPSRAQQDIIEQQLAQEKLVVPLLRTAYGDIWQATKGTSLRNNPSDREVLQFWFRKISDLVRSTSANL
ncbi:hypothetical protein AB5N19_12959 [Seiridium cardinale]